MRKLLGLFVCLLISWSFALADTSTDYYSYSYARLSYVNGDVFIQRAEDLGYEEGVVNLALIVGDKLGTKEGRAEVHLGHKNYLRIDRYTQIDITELPKKGFDLIRLQLLSGRIFLRVNFMEREKDFEIHTPDASFYILEEGLYCFDVKEGYETEIRVFEGTAEAAAETGSLLVNMEESLMISNGDFISEPAALYASMEDSFTEWNSSRDAFHNRYVGRNYLPSELNEYEAELDYYGRWAYERPYGYVWVPRVSHSSWQPYYNGRWVWYPVIGLTWVSYEPWGWCVSHYGRWHWRFALGWHWIPTRHWGPGWVHWYHGSSYYGWSPLSYYGYPGVIINNHYYGRYNRGYYPAHSRALVVVHKNQLQARHISKVALSRDHVSRIGKVSLSSRQPQISAAARKSSLNNSAAVKAMERSKIRRVDKAFPAGKTSIKSSGKISRGSIKARKSSVSSSRSASGVSNESISKTRFSKARSSQVSKRYSSSSSGSELSKARSSVKTYPSKGTANSRKVQTQPSSSFSRSRSSGREIKSYGSRSSLPVSKPSSSISGTKYRSSSIKKYSPQSSYSDSRSSSSSYSTRYRSPSRNYSSSKSYTSRYSSPSRSYSSTSRSNTPSRSYSSSRVSPSSSYSSSKSYTSRYRSPSRSYSSTSRSKTPSRSYSSSRSSSSGRSSISRSSSGSSRSSVKQSSSRSSTSSSTSTKKVRIK